MDNKNGFKYGKMINWQNTNELSKDFNSISEDFPKKEMCNLSSHIRRATDSIALNIPEGLFVKSSPEYKKFFGHLIRSLAEVVSCVYKAKSRKCITEEIFNMQYDFFFNIIIPFRTKI